MTRRRPLPLPPEETGFVVRLEGLTPPLDWARLFGRSCPVEVEIGCGKGRFLLEASRMRPESGFLGVEKAGKWFLRGVERVWRARAANVRMVQTDAFDLLHRWIAPASVQAIHLYFPDPWPKKRHAKRRLLRAPLYDLCARALPRGGALFLASDVTGYFEEAMEALRGRSTFASVAWPPDAPDRVPTHYALKYLRQGRQLHYAKFLRTEIPAPDPAGSLRIPGVELDPTMKLEGRPNGAPGVLAPTNPAGEEA